MREHGRVENQSQRDGLQSLRKKAETEKVEEEEEGNEGQAGPPWGVKKGSAHPQPQTP